MRKVVVFFTVVLFGMITSYGQGNLNAGVHAGLPIGDAGDLATFSIAVDLGYLFEISDQFEAGPTVGYSHSFGDSIDTGFGTVDIEDVQFVPVGGIAKFNASETFSIRGALGYAIGVSDGNDGGLYYSPQVGYSVSDALDLILAYRGVSLDGGSWDIISLGIEFGL